MSTPLGVCPIAFWVMLQSIMGYGYPPRCGQTNKVKLLPSCHTTYTGSNNGTPVDSFKLTHSVYGCIKNDSALLQHMSQAARGTGAYRNRSCHNKAKDIQFLVHTTVLLIAQFHTFCHTMSILNGTQNMYQEHSILRGEQATTDLKCVKGHILIHFIEMGNKTEWKHSGETLWDTSNSFTPELTCRS